MTDFIVAYKFENSSEIYHWGKLNDESELMVRHMAENNPETIWFFIKNEETTDIWPPEETKKERKARYQDNYRAITFPVFGAVSLLKAHKNDPGINVASARRALEAGWSLYTYLHDDLSKKQRERVETALEWLATALKENLPYIPRDKKNDGWTAAMREYNG